MKRLLSIALAAVLLLALALPAVAAMTPAPRVAGTFSIPAQVNPLYTGKVEPRTREMPAAVTTDFDPADYMFLADAAVAIRGLLKARTPEFTIHIRTADSNLTDAIIRAMDEAFAHTGVPNEGDYLSWQYTTWGASNITYYYIDGVYYLNIPYYVEYCTTAEQEARVDSAVKQVLQELDLDAAEPYEKVCGIYDYITDHVVYDFDNLNDNDYVLKYSAYAALINGTSVCQGYANLFYRLALELGVDNRIVVGEAGGGVHSWNLVKIGDYYYYADATWDAGQDDYAYFLKGSSNFSDHVAYTDTVATFLPNYPVSTEDYGGEGGNEGGGEGGQTPTPPDYSQWSHSAEEWEVLRETNRQRYQYGLAPLTTTDILAQIAEIRACEITEYFSHTRPNGQDCFTLIAETGIPYSMAAENIAAGQESGAAAVDAWMHSDGHRANLLGSGFTHLGMGYEYRSGDPYAHYWTQFFLDTWNCHYTGMALNLDSVTVEPGTGIEDIRLWATLTCAGCGDCYLPVLAEYCSGYDPQKAGTQTVTVSCLDWSDTLEITVSAGQTPAAANGDANGDGDITGLDVIVLRQYLAGWEVSPDMSGADANGDGDVTGLDVIVLRQYLAGWDVQLGG